MDAKLYSIDKLMLFKDLSPQHFGMLAGVLVFWATVITVVFLLVKGGSWSRMMEQAQTYKEAGPEMLQQELQPRLMLYDELLEASKTLPLCPVVPGDKSQLAGNTVHLKALDLERDGDLLYSISNGTPTLGHAYDPLPLWHRLGEGPFESADDFKKSKIMGKLSDGKRFVVVDNELGKIIGALSLLDNNPESLRIRIGDVWIAPNYGSNTEAQILALQEAVYLILAYVFKLNYRRVEWSMDEKDAYRIPAQAMGFALEGVLRKHMILMGFNRDTAVLSMTNSDWKDGVKEVAHLVIGSKVKKERM